MPKALLTPELAQTTPRFRFAAAVAAFGQLLRGGTYTETFGYGDVLSLARGARGEDAFGYRGDAGAVLQSRGENSTALTPPAAPSDKESVKFSRTLEAWSAGVVFCTWREATGDRAAVPCLATRAILKLTPVKTSSWDHTKLPKGAY